MALSESAEQALNEVVDAAEAMQEAGRRWGRTSKELELATKVYEMRMQEYYDCLTGEREQYWQKHCEQCPGCEECRVYDV